MSDIVIGAQFLLDSTAGNYRDGNFSNASPCGPWTAECDPEFAKEGDTGKYIWRQPYCQLGYLWNPLPKGSAGPFGSILVEESVPKSMDANLVRWDRIYAIVPNPRNVPESFSYNWQDIIENLSEQYELIEIPKTISSFLLKDYWYVPGVSTNPALFSKVPIIQTVKLGQFGTQFYAVPENWPMVPDANGNICVEDSAVKLWKGEILERATRFANAQSISPFDPS